MKLTFGTLAPPALVLTIFVLASLPAAAGTIQYNNITATTGTKDAWSLNLGYETADSFTLTQPTTITGIYFVSATNAGDSVTSVAWAITDNPFAGPTEDFGTASSLTSTPISTLTYPGNENEVAIAGQMFSISPNEVLAAGTYWLQLGSAVSADSGPVWWDESDGTSSAFLNGVGSINSESFEILGITGGTPSGIPGDPGTPATTAPEGGGISYLLLCALTCFGAIFYTSRNRPAALPTV